MQTLLGPKLVTLLELLARARHLEGSIAELGVYQGGALQSMAVFCPQKTCYGFDTFAGLPKESWNGGELVSPGTFGDVDFERLAREMPPNVVLKRGLFPASAEGLEGCFCFAHVDFDYEQSTAAAIAWLVPRMVPGGMIVFDDWRWSLCPGVEKAIVNAGLPVIDSAPYQCYWTAPELTQ